MARPPPGSRGPSSAGPFIVRIGDQGGIPRRGDLCCTEREGHPVRVADRGCPEKWESGRVGGLGGPPTRPVSPRAGSAPPDRPTRCRCAGCGVGGLCSAGPTHRLSMRRVWAVVALPEVYSSVRSPPAVCSAAVLSFTLSCHAAGSVPPEAQALARSAVVPLPLASNRTFTTLPAV